MPHRIKLFAALLVAAIISVGCSRTDIGGVGQASQAGWEKITDEDRLQLAEMTDSDDSELSDDPDTDNIADDSSELPEQETSGEIQGTMENETDASEESLTDDTTQENNTDIASTNSDRIISERQIKKSTTSDNMISAEEPAEEAEEEEIPAEEEVSEEEVPASDTSNLSPSSAGKVVVLDPGHTRIMSGLQEPLGPGSSELKDADTMGTAGVASGLTEYELNLMVCNKLRAELQRRGYEVYMTREHHDLMLSCVERAAVANELNADVFLRIHADGSTDPSAKGAMTICITPANSFHPELYAVSRRLSDDLINEYCMATGAKNRGVWETDSMTGNNWSEVPVTLLEMGFMTNAEEDLLMATDDYQNKIVTGIANGIDRFFTQQ